MSKPSINNFVKLQGKDPDDKFQVVTLNKYEVIEQLGCYQDIVKKQLITIQNFLTQSNKQLGLLHLRLYVGPSSYEIAYNESLHGPERVIDYGDWRALVKKALADAPKPVKNPKKDPAGKGSSNTNVKGKVNPGGLSSKETRALLKINEHVEAKEQWTPEAFIAVKDNIHGANWNTVLSTIRKDCWKQPFSAEFIKSVEPLFAYKGEIAKLQNDEASFLIERSIYEHEDFDIPLKGAYEAIASLSVAHGRQPFVSLTDTSRFEELNNICDAQREEANKLVLELYNESKGLILPDVIIAALNDFVKKDPTLLVVKKEKGKGKKGNKSLSQEKK